MALTSLVRLGSSLKSLVPNMGRNIGFESKVAAVLAQDSSPSNRSAGLSLDNEGNITFTTQSQKPWEGEVSIVKKLAVLSQGTIVFDEDIIDKLASTRNTTIAMVVSLCLSREEVDSVIIPASYWNNTKHTFHFNERTGALIVRSLWISLDKVSFTKKWNTIEIRKK